MPYIDRDKFLQSMTSTFKCVPLIGVTKTINGEECFDGEDLQQVLNQEPTEDVVPIAEVERLQTQNDSLEIENDVLHMNLADTREQLNDAECKVEQVKQDVAKELQALRAFKEYFDSLYGQGLEIENWHLNGKLEPYETFYDSAYEEFQKYIGE